MIERTLGERLPTQLLAGFDYQQATTGIEVMPESRGGGGAGGSRGARVHPGLAYLSSSAFQETLANLASARQAKHA